MPATEGADWRCLKCGEPLGRVTARDDGRTVLVLESDGLPSLIRDAPGFVVVECPHCGEERKWHKQKESAP